MKDSIVLYDEYSWRKMYILFILIRLLEASKKIDNDMSSFKMIRFSSSILLCIFF